MRRLSIGRIACALALLATVSLHADDRDDQHGRRRRDDDSTTQAEFILCAPAARVAAIARRHGLTVIQAMDSRNHDIFLVHGPVPKQHHDAIRGDRIDTFTHQLLDDVRADPDVLHFDINGSSVVTSIASSPQLSASTVEILDGLSHTATGYFGTSVWTGYVTQPALGIINLPQAQPIADGRGLTIAVIDTGVDPHHPALAGALVAGYDFTRDLAGPGSEWTDLDASTVEILDRATEFVSDPGAPVPVNGSTLVLVQQSTASQVDLTLLPHAFGHGTMVAGLIHLIAPAAKIMPLKAFDADGNSTIFDIERAIYYAVDHGAKIINMSFSSADATAEITHAIDYAGAHGVICLASAGNSGHSDVVFPAGYRNVMAIGSTSLADQRATFSNYGDHLVQFAAPGETLVTLYPGGGYAAVSGTSFSAAMISGGAALLSQLVPTLDQRLAGRYFDDGAVKRTDWELGNGRINLYETLRTHAPSASSSGGPTPDTTAPTVSLTAPLADASVTGTLQISATASDDVGIAGVQFTVDGEVLGDVAAAPYAFAWQSTGASTGTHVLSAIARDAAGNQSTSSVSIVVANDIAPPTVTFTAPLADASVTGTLQISAAAVDDVGVASVEFTIDGAMLGELLAAPYALTWDTTTASAGTHVLSAIARDVAGNQSTTSVSVVVANDVAAPTVTVVSPLTGASVAGTITLIAAASDDVGVAGVRFMLDGTVLGDLVAAPYTLGWDTTAAAPGAHVLRAIARDATGKQSTASVNVVVANDVAAPTVTVVSPSTGTTVSGTITLTAAASDDIGVAGVQFTLDGVNLGPERTSSPYDASWNSGSVANGEHLLGAVARDASGKRSTASVTITVANDTTAPVVAVTSPANGALVAGTITFAVSAADEVGVVGLQLMLDGVNLGAERLAPPYNVMWNSGSVANGTHVLAVVGRDAAGNQSSASITIAVANDLTAPGIAFTSPAADATAVAGTITLASAASDDVGVAGVQFTIDGVNVGAELSAPPYEIAWNSSSVGNGPHVLGAVARDAAGNQRAAELPIVVGNETPAPESTDIGPPDIAFLTPAADGASVIGTITLDASASDDVGVVGVQFFIDGEHVGDELAAAPYQRDWDSTAIADGAHLLTAVARDATGSERSVAVNIVVANGPN